MKLQATMVGDGDDEFGPPGPDVEVEFTDVIGYTVDQGFFTVLKENGDKHAVRVHRIKKFALVNN